MKKTLFPVLILVCNIVFSQTVTPATYSKIKFVYEQKSNFFIENDKLYADTLLFRITFPELKFSKGKSPIDSTQTIGFTDIKNLNKEDKKKFNSVLTHSTLLIKGTYDVRKNKTTLFYTRANKPQIDIYKKHFGTNFPNVAYNVVVDYNKREIYKNYKFINTAASLDSQLKTLTFTNEDKSIGTYTFQTKRGFQTDVVTLNKKHTNKITSDIVFSNNDFAVETLISIFHTIKLKSVSYE